MNDKTREMLEGALFQFQFMALMSLSGRADDADAAYAKGIKRLSAVLAEPEPEPEPEHLGQVTDPAANDEESDSARWRAERRLERLEERDEMDLY